MGSTKDWETLQSHIPSSYQINCWDLPGHGLHKEIPQHYTETIQEISNWLGSATGKKILVGYSMGARLAWHVAYRFPDLLDLLVIESGSPGIADPQEQTTRRQKDAKLFEPVLTGDQSWAAFLEAWFRQPIFQGLCRHVGISDLVENRIQQSVGALQKAINILGPGSLPSLWPHLNEIQIPTLFLTGSEDIKYCQIAEKCRKISSQVIVKTISNASHNIHLQHPEAFAGAIMNFVSEQSKVLI